jgi:hypothetical protein
MLHDPQLAHLGTNRSTPEIRAQFLKSRNCADDAKTRGAAGTAACIDYWESGL